MSTKNHAKMTPKSHSRPRCGTTAAPRAAKSQRCLEGGRFDLGVWVSPALGGLMNLCIYAFIGPTGFWIMHPTLQVSRKCSKTMRFRNVLLMVPESLKLAAASRTPRFLVLPMPFQADLSTIRAVRDPLNKTFPTFLTPQGL